MQTPAAAQSLLNLRRLSMFDFLFFFFKGSAPPRVLPSFPTRRSSDLAHKWGRARPVAAPVKIGAASRPAARARTRQCIRRALARVNDRRHHVIVPPVGIVIGD